MDQSLNQLKTKYPELYECVSDIYRSFEILKHSYENGGKVLLCGNGGSAADCEHIVGELMKGFLKERPVEEEFKQKLRNQFQQEGEYISNHLQGALPAISLVSHSSLMTAFANDVAPDMVFAQQVFGFGVYGDVVVGLSTSGNSKNVLQAMKVAKAKGMKTIGMTGRGGGQLSEICDVTISVPWDNVIDIQERHLPIYHTLCIMLENEFFSEN